MNEVDTARDLARFAKEKHGHHGIVLNGIFFKAVLQDGRDNSPGCDGCDLHGRCRISYNYACETIAILLGKEKHGFREFKFKIDNL